MTKSKKWLFSAVLILFGLFYAACLIVDNMLSPPVIGKPIYNCASIIAYGGADRTSKIYVYVNGTKVKEVSTWMGWGEITLPTPLNTGDIVSAAQVIGDHISVQTREPVTVQSIPAAKLTSGGRLLTPRIVPPLYECQKIVLAEDILNGATVHLDKNDVNIQNGMTPGGLIRFGVPALILGDKYDAWQSLCKDKYLPSDHSAKETVQKKPESLAAPSIHQPLVAGNDAVQVDNLFIGADVKIFSLDSTNPPVAVGGGTGLASSTIYHVSPVVDPNLKYYAEQYLCDLKSPPSEPVPPEKTVPPPIVQPPTCDGSVYVNVCQTVTLSTVKVYVNGVQVGQASGNGGCVTMALGNSTVLHTGDKVTASQTVAGSSSAMSAQVIVSTSGAPSYNPSAWNNPAWIKCNNCYNYGCDIRTDNFAQPGYAHGVSHSTTCPTVTTAAQADGLLSTNVEKKCTGCVHLVALVMDPGVDYHWYRLDSTGKWSHKPGGTPATNVDALGNPIASPETANRDYSADYGLNYSVFCGYFCVDKNNVVIAGWKVCH
jgi:hypothetical protein